MVEMVLSRILIRENSEQQVIFLTEKDGDRSFPIIIGMFEAFEINRKITRVETPRPMTHDLIRGVLKDLGARLTSVVVDSLKDATFYAKLIVHRDGEEIRIDSRPSDAIALAVATQVPIYVEDAVLDEVSGQME